jgi:hypothetical protein
MQAAFWWFAATVFAVIALYFYWSRKSSMRAEQAADGGEAKH